jgi:AcrR family transcriptional regulator
MTDAAVRARRSRRSGKEALLDAAERLFAEKGLEGVSLRQIGSQSGQLNTAAIHYHFGDKENLIREILERRSERFEKRRVGLLRDAISADPDKQVAEMLKVIFLPGAEIDQTTDRHNAARFAAQYMLHSSAPEAGDRFWNDTPLLKLASEFVFRRIGRLSREDYRRRMTYLNGFFLGALLDWDHRSGAVRGTHDYTAFLEEVFALMAWILSAPTGEVPPGEPPRSEV